MSKTIPKETLHTCTQCGQTGFTTSGLRTHQKSKTCKTRAKDNQIVKAGKPVQLKEFDQVRSHISKINELGRRAQHEMLLLGFALNKAKAALGERRGGDRKSGDQKPHGAVFDRWEDIVFQQTGYSVDTCDRWMKIAAGASKSLPILMSKDVMEKPFSALPEARQKEVEKILNKAVDGQTMHELMVTFGVWKERKHNGPPKPTSASAAAAAANANDEVLTQAQLIELAKEQAAQLHDIHQSAAFKALDTEDLANLENITAAYHADLVAEIKERRKAQA